MPETNKAGAQVLIERAKQVRPFVSVFGSRGAVIVNGASYYCIFCGEMWDGPYGPPETHKVDCLWVQMVALLSGREDK